ncbi:MAG: riboflavin synthase [Alphaproteobacteria bacterium]|nr:riboflavin synthase [Alphaproteobacteria bacterium]
MFTGLVQEMGTVRSVNGTQDSKRIEVEVSDRFMKVQIGASVCCSGCCLSVVEKSENCLFFDVSRETLDRTIIGSWDVMTRINLEPSLRMGDEMGGHIVSGHVDTTTKLLSIKKEGESRRLEIKIPESYAQYIASKGSVALDGISLTINEVEPTHFGINIIPHTWNNTTIGLRKVGDELNLEIDMLARYVARMMDVKEGQ